jgi:hypothetical protein
VDLSDLNCVVSQEVVPHELEVFAHGEESQHLSIVVEELLLGGNSSSSELLLKELEKLLVLLWWNWLQGLLEVVFWADLCFSLGLADVLQMKRLQFIQKKFKVSNKRVVEYLLRKIPWSINRNHKF